MSNRPEPRRPLPTGPVPAGRSGVALIGSILVVGGLALAALVSRGTGLFSNGSPGNTSASIQPKGQAPTDFVAFHASDNRYALFYSKTWKHQTSSITFNGQTVPADTFQPNGTAIPNWSIAFLASPVAQAQFRDEAGAMVKARENADFTATNGPVQTTNQWIRLDGTFQHQGGTVAISLFVEPYKTGSVLVFYEQIQLQFDQTEQQDFTPMLQSLNLSS